MSDTLVDEPVPPTERDPEEPVGAQAARAPSAIPRRPKPSRKSAFVATALVFSAVALGIGAGALFLSLRYEPVALRHVPVNAPVVVHVDLLKVATFPPIRDELAAAAAKPSSGGKTRVERIKDATGVNLASDLREVVVTTVDTASWLAIVGGKIARGHFVSGLAKLATDEKWPGTWRVEGGLLEGPSVVVGQADDGTILLATRASLVQAALATTPAHTRFAGLASEAISFLVTKDAWHGVAGTLPLPHADVLAKIEQATGYLALSDAPKAHLALDVEEGDGPAAVARDLDSLLGGARIAMILLPDTMGVKGAVSAAKVSVDGKQVVLDAPWSKDALAHLGDDVTKRLWTLTGLPN